MTMSMDPAVVACVVVLMLREGYGQTVRIRLDNGSWRVEALGVVVVG
jgi:hypothetical protein